MPAVPKRLDEHGYLGVAAAELLIVGVMVAWTWWLRAARAGDDNLIDLD